MLHHSGLVSVQMAHAASPAPTQALLYHHSVSRLSGYRVQTV